MIFEIFISTKFKNKKFFKITGKQEILKSGKNHDNYLEYVITSKNRIIQKME